MGTDQPVLPACGSRSQRIAAQLDWIRLLHANDFAVTDLVELRPPPGATTTYEFVTVDWARQWPSEEVWKASKRG